MDNYARSIKLLVMDVDGTLTDGGVYYDCQGNELKKFSIKDGAGLFIAKEAGLKLMILTGRECAATKKRMEELKVDYLFQQIGNKEDFLADFIKNNHYHKSEIGYIGDDINDLAAMRLVGFIGCPADSAKEVLEIADFISKRKGGQGAVRDIIEYILQEMNVWEKTVSSAYR